MVSKKSNRIFFWTTVLTLLISMILIAMLSGFQHESKKFKTLLVTIALVLLFQYLIGDPLKFVILAIDAAFWPPRMRKFSIDRQATHHNRLDFMKLRLRSLNSQLLITERHRNEELNEKYKHITHDLWLYGKYFFFLLLMVLNTRDTNLYYNTHDLTYLFYHNHTYHYGLNQLLFLNQFYTFVEQTIINAFTPNSTVQDTAVTGWVHAEQTKMLGVVRLRQLRLKEQSLNLSDPEFTMEEYMPEWLLPYKRLHYTDKYWRIYEPWLPLKVDFNWFERLLMNFDHDGHMFDFPELQGYSSLLARNRQNSMKVLNYLSDYNWLNENTSAVFLDFTLYNADANIFSICTLRIEQLPYGIVLTHVNVESVKLLENVDQLPHLSLLVVLIYVLVVIQFSNALVLKLWYEPWEMRDNWNKVDLVIFILNFSVVALLLVRELTVSDMLKNVEGASKMEFIDFRVPSRLQQLITILVGFLICITTLRLWKILQFADVIQMFTHTLFVAWKSMANTAMVIVIVLCAFAVALFVMNGNNSDNFNTFVTSVVYVTCFSFGFSSQINMESLSGGGRIMGIIMYALMGFIISILLINVFISIINDFFATTKTKRDVAKERKITFLQFLRVEFADLLRFIFKLRCFRKSYRSHNRTVGQNIRNELDDRETKQERAEEMELRALTGKVIGKIDDDRIAEHYRNRINKIHTLASILQTQMDILEYLIFDDLQSQSTQNDQ